jgi:glutamine synthetase
MLYGINESLVPAPVENHSRAPSEPLVSQPRLPKSLDEAISCLEADIVLQKALGVDLTRSFLAVRRFESAHFAGLTDDEEVLAHRFVY